MLRYIVIALVVCCVLYFIARNLRNSRIQNQLEYEQQRQERVRPEDNFNTIFVVIPCYRDEHACAETLYSLFNEAACPWRLRVVVVHHVHPTEKHYAMDIQNLYEHVVLRHNATSFQAQLKFVVESTEQASGPWDARNMGLAFFQNERFVMLVNSHSQFVREWDSKCLQQYTRALTLSPRPILTTYPAELDLEKPLETLPTYPIVKGLLTSAVYARVPVRPFPTFVAAPSFMFCSSRLLADCPHTLSLPFLSNKEGVMVMSARYYTYGWDFFTPMEPILYRTKSNMLALSNDRPDTRAQHELQQLRVIGLLNARQCRICEDDWSNHDEFAGHDFEPWPREHVFGHMRSIEMFIKHAQRGYLGITADVTAEEQIAKFDKIVY